jgi:hypothetical protein
VVGLAEFPISARTFGLWNFRTAHGGKVAKSGFCRVASELGGAKSIGVHDFMVRVLGFSNEIGRAHV